MLIVEQSLGLEVEFNGVSQWERSLRINGWYIRHGVFNAVIILRLSLYLFCQLAVEGECSYLHLCKALWSRNHLIITQTWPV